MKKHSHEYLKRRAEFVDKAMEAVDGPLPLCQHHSCRWWRAEELKQMGLDQEALDVLSQPVRCRLKAT